MDANRIKELADRLRSDQARQSGISQREMESCADLLDDLARIKSAALAESLAEIRQIHEQEEQDTGIILKLRAHRHRATLLDALRAKEAETKKTIIQWLENNKDEAIKMSVSASLWSAVRN